MPTRMKARQPRLAIPRSVNMEPESLRMSRRGSGRWRSSSASGLSMFQFEGSADNENWERRKGMCHGQRARLRVAVEERAVPCRPATWLTHRTVSRPWGGGRGVSIAARSEDKERGAVTKAEMER